MPTTIYMSRGFSRVSMAAEQKAARQRVAEARAGRTETAEAALRADVRSGTGHFVARKSHSDTIAARRPRPFKRLFFVSTRSHAASRGSGGGATNAMMT